MGWMSFADRTGAGWHVDLDHAAQLFYAEAFASERRRRARRDVTPGGIYPDTVTIAIDFRGFRDAVRQRAERRFREFQDRMWQQGATAYRMLVDTRIAAERDATRVREMQRMASRETSQNIDRAVRRGETGVAVAQFVRDRSADVLIIGSAFLTGGASVAVLGAGSLMQGTGTYQDTGNVGAAVVTTTFSFTFGLIPLSRTAMVGRGVSLAGREEAVLFVVGVANDATSAGVGALVQGQDARTALYQSLANSGMGWVSDRLTGGFMERLSFPARIAATSAEQRARAAVSTRVAEALAPGARPLPEADGCLSAACAVQAPRSSSQAFAENYVQLFVMSPVMARAEPMSGADLIAAIREGR